MHGQGIENAQDYFLESSVAICCVFCAYLQYCDICVAPHMIFFLIVSVSGLLTLFVILLQFYHLLGGGGGWGDRGIPNMFICRNICILGIYKSNKNYLFNYTHQGLCLKTTSHL